MNLLWKNIISNSFLLLSVRIISKVTTIAVMVLLARKLQVDSFGIISGVLVFTSLSGLVADFGLTLPSIRIISYRNSDSNQMLPDILATRLLWSFVAIIGMVILNLFLGFSFFLVILFTVSSILEIYATALIRSFEGIQKMQTITLYTLVERFIFCAIVLTSLYIFCTLRSIAIAYIISNAIVFIFAVILYQKEFGKFHFRVSFINWRKYSKIGFPFFITVVFSTLYYKADTILLSYLKSSIDVGIYNASLRVIDAQMFIPMTMMVSIFPTLSNLYHHKDRVFFVVFRRSLYAFVGIGLVVAMIVYIIAPWLIVKLYSSKYIDAIKPLQILSVMILFYFINFLLSQSLIAINLEKTFTFVMTIAAVFNIVCNWIIIPTYGFIGSAIIRVIIEIFITGIFSIFLLRNLRRFKKEGNV